MASPGNPAAAQSPGRFRGKDSAGPSPGGLLWKEPHLFLMVDAPVPSLSVYEWAGRGKRSFEDGRSRGDRDFGSGERRAQGGRIRSAACERGGESLFIGLSGGEIRLTGPAPLTQRWRH